MIQRNSRLLRTRNPFLDMMNDAYAHATASRVRRLIDRDSRTVSLRKLIEEIAGYPDLFVGRASPEDVQSHLAELDKTCKKVKDYVDQFVAHHDRSSSAPVPTHRELNEAIDTLITTFKKYYALINNADIDVGVSYLEDPLSIFRFAWIETTSSAGVP